MFRVILSTSLFALTLQIQAQTPDYIFRSGFENGTYIVQEHLNGNPFPNYADIYGTDGNYDWVQDLDNNASEIGNFRIYYEEMDTSVSKASIGPDPTDPGNQVLKYQISEPHITYYANDDPLQQNPLDKGRIQASLHSNPNFTEFYHRERLYLHPDLEDLKQTIYPITWFTLAEYWNNESNSDEPYRVTMNIRKDPGLNQELHFGAHGQWKESGVWNSEWDTTNYDVIVPLGTWIALETHFVEGDATTGVYKVDMTDDQGNTTNLFNITGYTHHPNTPSNELDGVTIFNPMKLYTSGPLIDSMNLAGNCLCIYWDDFEVWKDVLVTSVEEQETEQTKLYPNPTTGVLRFDGPIPVLEALIFDSTGKLVYSYDNNNLNEVDISWLAKGLYVVKLQTRSGRPETHRIVKL